MTAAATDANEKRPSAFGSLIKQWRLDRGLTQEELAERAGVSARLVSDLERGVVQRPRRDTAQMLADALELANPQRDQLLDSRRQSPESAEQAPSGKTDLGAIPVAPGGLIGRERELAAIVSFVANPEHRLVTLTGMGGVGKTRLALESARHLAEAFPDGLYFIDLTPLRDPSLLPAAIANAVGVQAEANQSPLESLATAIEGKQVLFVLDNLEHLPTASATVAELLARAPGASILATSREPLRLRIEIERGIDPLPIPDSNRPIAIKDLAEYPSVELLVLRASAVRPSFALNDGNAVAIAEIVQRLDGVPLAIELVASRIRSLSAGDLAERLEQRLPLLTRGAHDSPARHQTMEAAIDWSYRLLTETEQLAYRRFAVFDGGARLDAIEALCKSDLDTLDVVDAMQSLTEKHLVLSFVGFDGDTRFRMLETVREHGIAKLNETGEDDEVRKRHARWWLHFADLARVELTGSDQEYWLRAADNDHDNLRAALRWAIANADAETAHGISSGLIRYWTTRGYLVEARGWFEAALTIGDDRMTVTHAEALLSAGVIACFLNDYETAERHTRRAQVVAIGAGDDRSVASSYGNLGLIADVQGRYEEATTLYLEALARFRAIGDVTQAGYMLGNLGMIAYDTGEYGRAVELHHEALRVWRELNNLDCMAHSLSSLGQSSSALGQFEESTRLQIEALELRERLGNESGIAKCLECLAEIAVETGHVERAAWLLGAASAIRESIGGKPHPVDQKIIDRITDRSRESGGRRAFTHAWNAGASASREEVLAAAVDDAKPHRIPPPEQHDLIALAD